MVSPGNIVEYVEQGKFICGVVVEVAANRLRIFNQNGRELNLPRARVVHCSGYSLPTGMSRDEQRRRLQEVDQQRRELTGRIEIETVWELAAAEADQFFTPLFLAQLNFGGEADDDQVAAFLRAVFIDRLFFKYKDGQVMAHPAEVVEQLQNRLEQERQREALLADGARRLQALFVAKVPQVAPPAAIGGGDAAVATDVEAWPERERCLKLLQDYYLLANDAEESELARELLKRSGLTRPHDIYHLLVGVGVWQADENIPLLRAGVPVAFSEEEMAAAEACQETEADTLLAQGRVDLRHLPVLTIDGKSTRDLDDALHLERQGENFVVGIHIADVAHYVKPGSLLFKTAVERVTSLYFPEGQVPMLPPRLSEDLCSLVAGRDRPAMSFLVTLTPDGDIVSSRIVASVIRVARRLDYEQVEQLLPADSDLQNLLTLSQALRRRRIEAGALLLPIPDVNISIDERGNPEVSLEDVDIPARLLVSEMMVLANMLAAEYVAQQQVPGLFRSQDDPHQRLVHGYEQDIFTIWRQRKQLKPGQLLTRPERHSGVGAASYTTITSPIRRLLDLAMQHQVHGLIARQGAVLAEPDLMDLVAAINTTQGRLNQVKRERQRYWLLKYLQSKVGRWLDVLVVARGPRRVTVVLTDCLLEGDLPPGRGVSVEPGDVVAVKIAKADPLDGTLRLEW
ncbi:RNB domain-containing ribonuclease [Desulfurivibrio alkaliphilus]|uniref:Exoribonuclease II n=1 Tax=Desulfurivibrio alkaliphilus (strain DSM 19089 / UNIQEM U267 / AHT2) TaxID=589865 RepID=D6Z0I7_DESAT|nr:RNB domain-containing ribonuclease [Desulfurivibrio alkaliphilus]ADH85216.1 Exoribonuclease II [Desulfurivibrio alkaliphilus AHT 2]